MTAQEELDLLYKKAQQIAFDFIGPPIDQEDENAINNATPMQAILALELKLRELLTEQHKRKFSDVAPKL